MATINWNFDISGEFRDALDWQGGSIPGSSDVAQLGADGGVDYIVESRSGVLGLALGGTQTVGGLVTASNATLQVIGDVDALDLLDGDTFFNATAAGEGVTNAGTIVIQDAVLTVPIVGTLLGASATFEAGGAIDNTGVISINGRPHLLGLLDADQSSTFQVRGATTLTGGGQINMTNETLNFISGQNTKAVLTNVDNTITGAGYIGEDGMSFVNEADGIVDAQGSNRLELRSRSTLQNAGLLEASNHGALVICDSTVANTGTIAVSSGSRVVIQASDIEGGLIAATGSGYVVTNSGSNELDGSASAVTLEGQMRVRNGTELTLDGAIDNTGKIYLVTTVQDPSVTTLKIGADGVTLTGGGQVVSTAMTQNHVIGVSGSATLDNVNNRIALAGNLGEGELTLVNGAAGRIVADYKVGLVIDTGAVAVLNAGLISSSGAGGLTIKSGLDNTGVLDAYHGDITVDGAVTGSGVAKIQGATLDFVSGFSENVIFGKPSSGATSGVLELGDSVGYGGDVFGFSSTGTTSFDLADIASGAGTSATFSGNAGGGILTVTDGTDTAKIHLSGDYLGTTFNVANDGHGGTTVTDTGGSAASASRLAAAMAQMPSPASATSSAMTHAAIQPTMLASPSAHA